VLNLRWQGVTIAARFKKHGYTLDMEQNKYMLDKNTKEYNDNDMKEAINLKGVQPTKPTKPTLRKIVP
jgi:hypothetical protein